MNQEIFNLISVILAVGAVASPMIIGSLIFRLSKYFLSKNEFSLFQEQMSSQHEENKTRLSTIEDDIKELIRR